MNRHVPLAAFLLSLTLVGCQSQEQTPASPEPAVSTKLFSFVETVPADQWGMRVSHDLRFDEGQTDGIATIVGQAQSAGIEQVLEGETVRTQGLGVRPTDGVAELEVSLPAGSEIDRVVLNFFGESREGIEGSVRWSDGSIQIPFRATPTVREFTGWTQLEFDVPPRPGPGSAALRLRFETAATRFLLGRVRLLSEPASRMALRDVSGERLPGRRVEPNDVFEWTVPVPTDPAALYFAMAVMPSPAPTEGSVSFRVIAWDGTTDHELMRQEAPYRASSRPQWIHARQDLSAFAGQTLLVRFETRDIEPAPDGARHRLYWGDPRVFVSPPPGEFNVLVIGIDALRADHLGSYGCTLPITPVMDNLAASGARFTRCVANSPWTLPSFASLLTGQHPSTHQAGTMLEAEPGQALRPSLPLPEEAQTLAEAMGFAGFRTGMFYNNVYLDAEYGVQQGFETVRSFNGNGFTTVSRVLEWMRGGLESRNFAFVHLMEPHEPYDPPEPFRSMVSQWYEERRQQSGDAFESLSSDRRDEVVRYAGEVAYTDFLIGKLMRGLANMGLDGHTLVVLTSDHGEEFWEHEAIQKRHYVDPRNGQGTGHGHTQYDELLSVPLIVYFPGRIEAGLQIESLSQLHDLMPTILEWVGLRASAEVTQGRSLLPALRGEVVRDHAFSEFIRYGDERTAFRSEQYKLIVGGGLSEFYDLKADPDEQVNLFDQNLPALIELSKHAQRAQEERAAFQERLRQTGYGEQNAAAEISPATLERLKALGYAN